MNNFNQNPDSKVDVECDVTIPKEQFDLLIAKANIELIQRVNRQIDLLEQKTEAIQKINEYLSAGGLFNPELMDPEAVRNMLIEVRDMLVGSKRSG